MLTSKERAIAARMARLLQAQKRAAKVQAMQAVSGNVSCYLNSMTENKKADMGFYRADQDGLFMKKRRLQEEIKKLKDSNRVTKIIRVTHNG
jgi:4-hydroxy-3-methylbut-2-en-1-yl diphosphate synthase IspG/GcpE